MNAECKMAEQMEPGVYLTEHWSLTPEHCPLLVTPTTGADGRGGGACCKQPAGRHERCEGGNLARAKRRLIS
jgi:hypothetical protein